MQDYEQRKDEKQTRLDEFIREKDYHSTFR